MSPPYELRTPSNTESPLLHVGEARSIGELVTVAPQPAAPTVNRYDHAVALVDTMRASIHNVSDRTGPRAQYNALDRWIVHDSDRHGGIAWLGLFAGGVPGVVSCLEFAFKGATKLALVTGAICAVASIPTYIAFSLEGRMERRKSKKLESGDVERMLKPYVEATLQDRAVLARFVRAETDGLVDGLSPKATLTRNKVLTLEVSSGAEDPQLERVTQLAFAIRGLRDAATAASTHIATIEKVIDGAPPDERRQIASTLQRMLFKGEHPTFNAPNALQVQLYTAMDSAARGEATKNAESDSAQ